MQTVRHKVHVVAFRRMKLHNHFIVIPEHLLNLVQSAVPVEPSDCIVAVDCTEIVTEQACPDMEPLDCTFAVAEKPDYFGSNKDSYMVAYDCLPCFYDFILSPKHGVCHFTIAPSKRRKSVTNPSFPFL